MLALSVTSQFKKDRKRCIKHGYPMELLNPVVNSLLIPELLPAEKRDHSLTGNYSGHRECHILPDWLLIYRATETELVLVRTGTHSDLFSE